MGLQTQNQSANNSNTAINKNTISKNNSGNNSENIENENTNTSQNDDLRFFCVLIIYR